MKPAVEAKVKAATLTLAVKSVFAPNGIPTMQ